MFNVQIKDLEKCRKEIEVEVPADFVESIMKEEINKIAKDIQIPGFRKGKVPHNIIKSRLGKNLEQEVISKVVASSLEKIIIENKINIIPSVEPKINLDEIKYKEGQPISYKVEVVTIPDINLKEYKGLEVTKEVVEVNEMDVDEYLKGLQRKYARLVSVTRRANNGDFIIFDVECFDENGDHVKEEEGKSFAIELGMDDSLKEFHQALFGAEVGETVKVSINEAHEKHGIKFNKRLNYHLTVKEIKEKHIPELDDEFAKDLSFNTLEELREQAKKDLERKEDQLANEIVENKIISLIIERNPFDIPDVMVDKFLDSLVEDTKKNMKKRYLDEFNEEEFRKIYREYAIYEIKRHLILEKIADMEQIKVTEDEINEEVEKFADKKNLNPDVLRKKWEENNVIERVESRIKHDKVLDFLLKEAKITTTVQTKRHIIVTPEEHKKQLEEQKKYEEERIKEGISNIILGKG